MQATSENDTGAPRELPDWGALILINLASFAAVASLVLLSFAFDALVFNLG